MSLTLIIWREKYIWEIYNKNDQDEKERKDKLLISGNKIDITYYTHYKDNETMKNKCVNIIHKLKQN